nr:hypothetical protein GCM10020063_058300 [Dactylosporangium thailandense]
MLSGVIGTFPATATIPASSSRACGNRCRRTGEFTAAGMTTGGVTTAIDRLERAGYVTRERDADDRRRVTVRPTPLAQRSVQEIYGPVVEQGTAFLRHFDDTVLAGMIEILEFSTRQHNSHLSPDGV